MRSRLSSAYMRQAAHNWRWLLRHWKAATFGLDLAIAGNNVATKTVITATRTNSSTKVKAWAANSERDRRIVTQIFNLLYRRFVICESSDNSGAFSTCRTLPSATRRYGGLEICATKAKARFIWAASRDPEARRHPDSEATRRK